MVLLLIILIATTKAVDRNAITDLQRHQCFSKDVLAKITLSSNQMAVHKKTNMLYFSSNVNGMPMMLDIDTKELKVIKGVKDAYAITSNNDNDEIYFGGNSGIHRYRPVDKTLTSLAITNLDIWWLYFKKHIYFIQFPHLHAYMYADRTIKVVRKLKSTNVHQFVFDKYGCIFFLNASGLYGVQKYTYAHILLRSNPPFLGMATDNTGSVFVCSDTAIYIINKSDQKLKRVVSVSGVIAIAFDAENHLIYSDGQELVRLLPVTFEMISQGSNDVTYFCK